MIFPQLAFFKKGWPPVRWRLNWRLVGALLLALLGLFLVGARLAIFLASLPTTTNTPPLVIPSLREWHGGVGTFTLTADARIVLDPSSATRLRATATVFQQDLQTVAGLRLPIITQETPSSGDLLLTLKNNDSGIGSEGYVLLIADSLTISAHSEMGVFYGTRTVLQMLMQDPLKSHLAHGIARDYPRYAVRGFMLDVGRRYFTPALLEDYVRLLSWFKMNEFQLHLNDNAPGAGERTDWRRQYAAFRLQSARFPGLAARDGAYSRADMASLQALAQTHAVTILPEIDTPAHDLALTQYRPDLASPRASKEFLNLANPATMGFVENLWSEFLPWFSSSQVHIGADEYALNDADRYRTFVNRLAAFLSSKGKTVRMWGSLSLMKSHVAISRNIVLDIWNNRWANPVQMVREGFQVINMNDNLLYIVPRAGYYHDYLDTKTLYTRWQPFIFDLSNPRLNLAPNDPHLLGAMFALWNDKLNVVSDAQIDDRIEPAVRVLSQKLWSGVTPLSYGQFEQLALQLSTVPGAHLPELPQPFEFTPHQQDEGRRSLRWPEPLALVTLWRRRL
ncbi:MAG: family 20 glycosylhydrolase [Thermogemmatispora sp.]|uniref:family 20 glycosylhydrolase n=1 Tax=Thermogemmatispora sp. TaxID=1968838 RepID=UPI002629D5CA|nr:family 20 glycosylhydrolase [Thermogemmatispora sp.]MBX5458842.1 family 20 glycosylhydrolase [Thermogemmatispora sp.]